MRATVELVVRGKDIDDILEKAKKRYQEFMGDEDAEMPSTTEVNVKERTNDGGPLGGDMLANITIRTRLGSE